MKDCNCKPISCGCDGCRPSRYGDCSFEIQSDPFDAHKWVVTVGGKSHRIRIPDIAEKDTRLSLNTSAAELVYDAEKHRDTITGQQLGAIIELGDLRDVEFNPAFEGTCAELMYHKYADCGEGCTSPADKWSGFNIFSNGARKDYIRYPRGANVYGCPEYLEVPENLDEFYFAGWKRDGEHKEFGYYQAEPVETLPKDENGDFLVMSVNPTNKKPVVAPLPLDCILKNLAGNLGIDVAGVWSVVQETPEFSATIDAISGDFTVEWNDWYAGTTPYTHVGRGVVTGKVNWTFNFDVGTGSMIYHIESLYFNKVVWTVDQGAQGIGPIAVTLKGISIPDGTETTLLNAYSYSGEESWQQLFDRTILCDQTITLGPRQSIGPLNFLYLFVDWVGDDEGYMSMVFKNKFNSWIAC